MTTQDHPNDENREMAYSVFDSRRYCGRKQKWLSELRPLSPRGNAPESIKVAFAMVSPVRFEGGKEGELVELACFYEMRKKEDCRARYDLWLKVRQAINAQESDEMQEKRADCLWNGKFFDRDCPPIEITFTWGEATLLEDIVASMRKLKIMRKRKACSAVLAKTLKQLRKQIAVGETQTHNGETS